MMANQQPPVPPNSDDENREYNDWLNKRKSQPEIAPPSVEFMEMMRQAATRYQPSAEDGTPVEAPFDAPPDDLPELDAPEPLPLPTLPLAAPMPVYKTNAPVLTDDDEFEQSDTLSGKPARRRKKRGSRTIGVFAGILRTLIVIVFAAGLTATIFTWFTPSEFISSNVRESLSLVIAADNTPVPANAIATPNWARRIGIVSGHRGPENDPGAVCPDGLTEAEINLNVAQMVVSNLQARGYTTVDLLDEFDPRLDGYQASALVSIHVNSCQDYGEVVSGFLISTASARVGGGRDDILVDCIAQNYAVTSGLERRTGLTIDMTDYHTFREINFNTPAAIIELGFLRADRDLLTGRPDALAQGITDGILCFLEPGVAPPPMSSTPGA